MKMRSSRSIEIAMAVYIAVAVAFIHMTPHGVIFSALCGVSSWLIIALYGKSTQKIEECDSWGWSKAATKSLLVVMAIILIGGGSLHLKVFHVLLTHSYPSVEYSILLFWQIADFLGLAMIMWFAVYLRDHFTPINNKSADSDSLKLEHQQWIRAFQAFLVLLGVIFIAAGFSYVVGFQAQHSTALVCPP